MSRQGDVLEPFDLDDLDVAQLEGRRLRLYRAGAGGTPLLLLHGTAIDSARLTFGPSAGALAREREVVALDWPGHGGSPAAAVPLGVTELSALLTAALERLALERVDLLGFSLGGAVALLHALEQPARVRRLVLVSSYGLGRHVHLPIAPYLALRTPLLGRAMWAVLRRSRALLELALRGVAFSRPGAVGGELVEEVAAQLGREGSERAFMHWLRSELGPLRLATDLNARLAEVRAPTLLLHGRRDLVVPAWRSLRAARRIPEAMVEVWPTGHWLPREASARFAERVGGFLEGA